MSENHPDDVRELPIVKLAPRSKRQVDNKHFQRMKASLRAVGLLKPLVVCDQGDTFEILDGHLRYEILRDFGVTTIPCLLEKEVQNHE